MAAADHRIQVIHGVNLGALHLRDTGHYGDAGRPLHLQDLERKVDAYARELCLQVGFFQTDFEGELVQHLHGLRGQVDGIVINAGAWTHYSWALRDALQIACAPAVEVHLSDVQAREPWRRVSVFEGLCLRTVSGQGLAGYKLALQALRDALSGKPE